MTSDIKTFNYYGMDKVDTAKVQGSFKNAVDSIAAINVPADASPKDFVNLIFSQDSVANLLVFLSRLPVFDKDFAMTLSHDLDLLALAKKLKFYTNLPLGQNLLLLQ